MADGVDTLDSSARDKVLVPVKNLVNEIHSRDIGRKGREAYMARARAGTASVTVPMTETITANEGLSFTVFTVPVINNDALRIRFTSKDGEDATKTSWVDLKYSNSEAAGANAGKALQFQAGHKYRINMLKLPSNQWKISITAVFEEWAKAEDEVVIYI